MKRLDTTIALQGAKIPKLANTIAAEVISMILNGMEVQLRVFEATNQRNSPKLDHYTERLCFRCC